MSMILIVLADAAADARNNLIANIASNAVIALIMWQQNRILHRGNEIAIGGKTMSPIHSRSIFEKYWPLIAMVVLTALTWGAAFYRNGERIDSISILAILLLASVAATWGRLFWTSLSRYRRSLLRSGVKYTNELVGTMSGNPLSFKDGIYELGETNRISTKETFSPPVAFKLIAKTNSTNIRIGYIADAIIFRWECDKKQLRIDGGPLDGDHKIRVGDIPIDDWVAIELIATKKWLSIWRDGEEVYFGNADLTQIRTRLSIFQGDRAIVSIKSILVDK